MLLTLYQNTDVLIREVNLCCVKWTSKQVTFSVKRKYGKACFYRK